MHKLQMKDWNIYHLEYLLWKVQKAENVANYVISNNLQLTLKDGQSAKKWRITIHQVRPVGLCYTTCYQNDGALLHKFKR